MANIAPSTLSSWYSRNTMDYVKVAQAFPKVNAEWLLRDKGPMTGKCYEEEDYKGTRTYERVSEECYDNESQMLSALIAQLDEKDKQINSLLTLLKQN